MMEILDAVKGRRSIRRFTNTPLPASHLKDLEDSLLEAPSAGNLQSRRFYFVFRDETRKRLADAGYRQDFIAAAPLAVVCCADLTVANRYGERGRSLYCLQDVASSIQNLMLVAYSLGLGTVWVGAFDEREVSRILNLPDHLRPVAIVPVGYPDEKPPRPGRVRREEAIVHLR
jgi:nitroreductase